jgi:hypothetical protein
MEREKVHNTIKTTKHFFSIKNSDSNDFENELHNPASINITFQNPITNIQSYNDETRTIFHIMSLSADLFYHNISQPFKNNRIRISSITTDASPAIRVGATNESVAPIIVEIPTNIYQTGTELAAALTTALNAKLIAWIGGNVLNNFAVAFSQATNRLTISYNIDAPAGIAALLPILVFRTIFTDNSVNYDSSRILGATTSTINAVNTVGSFQLPYANRVAGLAFPNFVDLQTLQTIRVHSNVAKRFYTKVGSATTPPAQRLLSLTDILFEFPADALLGQTLSYIPHDNRYSQEISSNFDEFRITLTDNFNNPIDFLKSAELNMTFAIEREIIIPTNEERIKALSEYNRFKSY